MRIDIVSPALPPILDGIGDYTAQLAAELSQRVDVTVLTGLDASPDPISGVSIKECFSPSRPASTRALLRHTLEERPDWLLLEYNPFGYGRWGLNLHLPLVLNAIRRRRLGTRIAIMFHELFTPVIDVRFALMTTWQRAQVVGLGRSADCLFCSVEAWTSRLARRFTGKPLVHLPVGSNILPAGFGRDEARASLGIGLEKVVLGVFGTAHPSRMLELTRTAAQEVLDAGHDAVILYVGPHAPVVEQALAGLPLVATADPVEPTDVSRHLAAMDVHLVAFVDGVSTRRGTLMAGLAHGVPTLATLGPSTDSVLRRADNGALLLSPVEAPETFCHRLLDLVGDVDLRQEIGVHGRDLYRREFDWPILAKRLLEALPE